MMHIFTEVMIKFYIKEAKCDKLLDVFFVTATSQTTGL